MVKIIISILQLKKWKPKILNTLPETILLVSGRTGHILSLLIPK